MSTLLEKALATVPRQATKTTATVELAELAIAWAHGRVTAGQASRALGLSKSVQGSMYNKMAYGLRFAIQTGMLKEKTR